MRLKHLRFFAVECFTNDSRKDGVECFIYRWNFGVGRSRMCVRKFANGSRYLRNIRRRSARTGRRKTKQEEDERWERRKPQPRRITMDHLLGSPFLDTTDTIGYSSGPLLRPAISPDRFRSNPVISDYRWMQTLLSQSREARFVANFSRVHAANGILRIVNSC